MKKHVLLIGCITSILFTGCTEEEKTQTVNQITTSIETNLEQMGLKEQAQQMATDSLQKIQEAYVDEQKVMMDNAYKFGQEYTKLLAEQAKAALTEMEQSTTTTTTSSN